jgi:hypothetical protein
MKLGYSQVIDDAKDEMRWFVLEALLKIPWAPHILPFEHNIWMLLFRIIRTHVPIHDADSDGDVVLIEHSEACNDKAELSTPGTKENTILSTIETTQSPSLANIPQQSTAMLETGKTIIDVVGKSTEIRTG